MLITDLLPWRIVAAVHHRQASEQGFTLVELLMVMLILPLIMGAIAAAIIVSLDNEQSVSNRLSDSVDSQITSAFYVRDVQGAEYVTTTTSVGSYSAVSPQVCPSSNPGGQLLLGVYHPADPSASVPALDVGYWLVGTSAPYSVVRYSCTLNASYNAQTESQVAVAGDVSSAGEYKTASSTYVASIEPSQFQAAAAAGWAQVVATTYVVGVGSSYLDVVSTAGFTSGVVNVDTPVGSQQLSCTAVASATQLTCANPSSIPVVAGEEINQDSAGDINLAVTQSPANNAGHPGVEYHYSLTASPRTQAPCGSETTPTSCGGSGGGGGGGGGGGPSLLTLGTTGISVTGTNTINVTGNATVDGGSVSCSGSGTVTVTGTFDGAPGVSESGSGCTTMTSGSYQPDPLAPYLPSCAPAETAGKTTTTIVGGSSYLTYEPGRYTSTIPPSNVHGTIYFEPGLYELDAGISVGSNQSISIVPGSGSNGLLLYIPGYNTTPGCDSAASPSSLGTFNLGGGGAADLPPLTSTQSATYFDGNTSLGGVWIWQDATNASGANLGGGSSAAQSSTATPPVLAYLPSAIVSFSGSGQAYTGALICAGLNLVGGGSGTGLTVTGS